MVVLSEYKVGKGLITAILIVTLLVVSIPPVQAQALLPRFEGSLGKSAVPEILKQYGGEHVLPIHKRLWVEEVFSRLVQVAERDDLEYTLIVLNSSELNAFSLPGGFIFITRGLVQAIGEDEAKLAAVLGHEIAHVEKKHGLHAVFRQLGLTVLFEVGALALDLASADLLRVASVTLVQLLNLGWGREAEYEADLYGQQLAIQAGFDGVGAVRLLDDLFSTPAEDLPMKVFRTHPESKDRRERLAANLYTFWSPPRVVQERGLLERLEAGRNSKEDQRKEDPEGRYLIRIDAGQTGLEVCLAEATEAPQRWLEGARVKDFAWSPQGQFVAVIGDGDSKGLVWICDRRGNLVRSIGFVGQELTDLSWSPDERQVALHVVGPGGPEIRIAYTDVDVIFSLGPECSGDTGLWLETGLYFVQEDTWYQTREPQVEAVWIPSPIPQVLQRQRILSPQVIREGHTIRLTRPSLTVP